MRASAREPMRTCIGCRAVRPQRLLQRCALTAEGAAVLSRTASGRGAWLCSAECLAHAAKRNGFARAWRRPVPEGALAELDRAFGRVPANMRESRTVGSAAGTMMPTKG